MPPLVRSSGARKERLDPWSLDIWAFWREGSSAAPIAQNRAPVYGASQAGAILRYRVSPNSRNDPELFARAYQALVPDGETELAAGASARPFVRLPIRLVAELRVTDDLVGTELRPAAVAFTEIAPLALLGKFTLEAYGAAGYVGGRADTAFADGQIVSVREVAAFDGGRRNSARVSIGAGAWGGAQKDAERLDAGPTVRMDFSIAEQPARLSLDYRSRVAGNAAPESGATLTLSTRF